MFSPREPLLQSPSITQTYLEGQKQWLKTPDARIARRRLLRTRPEVRRGRYSLTETCFLKIQILLGRVVYMDLEFQASLVYIWRETLSQNKPRQTKAINAELLRSQNRAACSGFMSSLIILRGSLAL